MGNAREKAWGADKNKKGSAGNPQLSFAERKTWGGPRKGAGRKAGLRPRQRHLRREPHSWWNPVLVTLRRAKGLPSLRCGLLHKEMQAAVRRTKRDDFRIVHYSVQADHVHLIVESETREALSAGMKSFAVSAALRLNFRVLRRKRGRVWGDRYHRRELTSPRQVRNVLVYVLANHLKHGETDDGVIDPCSSGPWFRDWVQAPPRPSEPSPVEPARTYLLDRGWHRGWNFIIPGEVPRALRA
jgi:REP element-mobilizing transposase RayT